jgi:hypothetical protein
MSWNYLLDAMLTELHNTITSDREWQRDFKASLTRHDEQIGNLLTGLRAEQDTRQKGEDKLSASHQQVTVALNQIEGTLSWLKGAAWVVGILLSMIVIPLLVNFFAAWFAK